ncbi:hypothetical protein GA0070624_1420 [Micromonospora rhizosphaerae]|uniref:Uncharacterized protein n=1 Tax=Micromonospora rhizosphaerae TaxID=568872 RepID=A0A1C6RLD1_9ACTN|nr:hypothetical protein [Micromonospora rhizosphaerae]SCL17969.1 hypothetical protein GA0070624_1420 [Micromonospora rhizosphaerae]
MAKKDRSRQQATEQEQRRKQDMSRSPEWADRAALARTADDSRATAPRDTGGRPSNGRQF